MKQFRLVDNIMGWLAFAIAAFVYCSTIEPTASFWDCPEFISTGYKLEIGHPPGAPFFMLTANLFSQFASDPSQVARMVNTMSALLSAATILFLFWTISHLVRRLLIKQRTFQVTFGIVSRELLVIVYQHDGRQTQQVQQVDTNGEARHIHDEHQPAVGMRLVGMVFPFQNQPEYHSGKG